MLRKKSVEFVMSKSLDVRGILGCLEKANQADIVYVVNAGLCRKDVSVDIGYAYARNKSIYGMHPVEDPPVMSMCERRLTLQRID